MDDQPADKKDEQKPEEVLVEWKSPSRLFKKRDREYYTNIGAIVFLLVVILVFAREYMFILAILSIVFFIYATSTVPPEDVEHRITNLGMETAGHFYRWGDLVDFWYEEQWGQTKMIVNSLSRGRLFIILGGQDKEEIRKIVAEFVPYRENPPRTWFDNASSWISRKIPLEKPS